MKDCLSEVEEYVGTRNRTMSKANSNMPLGFEVPTWVSKCFENYIELIRNQVIMLKGGNLGLINEFTMLMLIERTIIDLIYMDA